MFSGIVLLHNLLCHCPDYFAVYKYPPVLKILFDSTRESMNEWSSSVWSDGDPKVRKWLNPHCMRVICRSTLPSIGSLSPFTAFSLASVIGLHLSHPWVARQQAFYVCLCVCALTHCCGNVRLLPVREEREMLRIEGKADEREALREERGKKWEWVRALMKRRDSRGESQKALDCFWPFLQPSCIYIQACHYLSEVTGKDGMIYQTGRQAGCKHWAVIGWNREV